MLPGGDACHETSIGDWVKGVNSGHRSQRCVRGLFCACLTGALVGHVAAIVSGDHHLLDLGKYEGIPILSASDFLANFL